MSRLIACGYDAITQVPAARWDVHAQPALSESIASRVRHGGFVVGAELADNAAFAVSPAEVVAMDPCQRLLLEHGYAALHDASLDRAALGGSLTGVFLGFAGSEFAGVLATSPAGSNVYAATGAASSIAAGRVSYTLGLHGPCVSYDTACSAALVAAHAGVRALQLAECGVSLVAGVTLMLAPGAGMSFAIAGMTSARGRSHTFDARADGYARGEACGGVVLHRGAADSRGLNLQGSAVRQDGRSASLTAPNGRAQEGLLVAALSDGGVEPGMLTLNEAHGTGTALGDPIEAGSLAAAVLTPRGDAPLLVGGVKANIGHAEPAAGMTGLLKLALGLRWGEAAPNAQLRVLNPHLGGAMDGVSGALPVQLTALGVCAVGRGGVSSFGYSGTIAHAVLHLTGEVGLCSPCAAPLFLPYRRHAFPWREASGFAMRTSIHPSVTSPSASIHHTVIKDSITADTPLMQAGVTSISAVRLSSRLSSLTSVTLSPVLVFEQPTPRAIALHLSHAAVPPQFSQAEVFISIIEELLVQNQSSVPTDRTVPKSHFHPAIGGMDEAEEWLGMDTLSSGSVNPHPRVCRCLMLHGLAANAQLMQEIMHTTGWLDQLATKVKFVFIDALHEHVARPDLYRGLADAGLYGAELGNIYYDYGYVS